MAEHLFLIKKKSFEKQTKTNEFPIPDVFMKCLQNLGLTGLVQNEGQKLSLALPSGRQQNYLACCFQGLP